MQLSYFSWHPIGQAELACQYWQLCLQIWLTAPKLTPGQPRDKTEGSLHQSKGFVVQSERVPRFYIDI